MLKSKTLRNRLISGGLELVLSHTEKLCQASYYTYPVFYEYKMYNHKIKTSFFSLCLSGPCTFLYPWKAVYNTMREITNLVFNRIRWIGTGSHQYEKTLSSIVFYPAFYEYKMYNHKIKTSFISRCLRHLGA